MPFSFAQTPLEGVVAVTPRVFADDRGSFFEAYKASEFADNGIQVAFVQDNQSTSDCNVLRGLHYQNHPAAQGKLVRCVVGQVWDVAVDIRRGSPQYGEWFGMELTAENGKMLYIPPGFAHGFLTLSATATVTYKVTAEYAPDAEAGIAWDDPTIGIQWPGTTTPLLSAKDSENPPLADANNSFDYQP